MELQSERQLPWPRQRVWSALNDPGLLQQCIPGCESMEAIGDYQYHALVQAKVGPVKARFRGQVSIADLIPPESYILRFEGQGGAAGFARGEAEVYLLELDGGGSALRYSARAIVGGKLAQIGSRLVQSAARKMADEFFDNFITQLQRLEDSVDQPQQEQAEPEETEKRNWKFWNDAGQGTN
ncbi:MAG TPA: carbon monoxide dehydrogenase subunit G [Gammaproteobacteria bacterium]|nr:carbon monoxide dehydrogenase subunit G [Gammaproteobacteria bacterium]